MKTLYTRIVLTVFLFLLLSGALSLLVSNVVYHVWWQPSYSEKVEGVAKTARTYFTTHTDADKEAFYTFLSQSGYQLVVFDEANERTRYGGTFRTESIDPAIIQSIREGQDYEGMRDYPFHLFLLGLFDNELTNTYGFALESGTADVVFIRPDLGAQIRELHLFVGLFFGLLTLFAFILIAWSTRFLVRPLQSLTNATTEVANGVTPITLPIRRRDEIGTLARQFSDMTTAIRQSETRQRRFVSNVSHEFQSPLTSLSGYAERLVRATSGQTREDALIIRNEATRLSQLTRQLLLLAQLDEGKPHAQSDVSLKTSIDDVIRTNAFQLDQKGIAVSVAIPPGLVVTGDPILLTQVWSNLLTNAIRACDEGGNISIRAERDEQLRVTFRDDGMGMDDETLARITERFFQGDASRSSGGAGLGLAITADIVHLHGGTLTFASSVGNGTTVTVSF